MRTNKLEYILAAVKSGKLKYNDETRTMVDMAESFGLVRKEMIPFGNAIRFTVHLTLQGIRTLGRR